jgi:cytochrome c-type biogenesis protein CcmH/NrfG
LLDLDPITTAHVELYEFEKENEFLKMGKMDAMQEYERLKTQPKVSLSTLALVLEAVVQMDPANSEAWMNLGLRLV